MALINKLNAIGDAIREKTGKSDLLTLDAMATEISNLSVGGGAGGDLPEEALNITGNCNYKFANGGWDWFINTYGNRVDTTSIMGCEYMFFGSQVSKIPFTLWFNRFSVLSLNYTFAGMSNLTILPAIQNCQPNGFYGAFNGSARLREVNQDFLDGINWAYLDNCTGEWEGDFSIMFPNCYSLRTAPYEILRHQNPYAATSYSYLWNGFNCCYALDELVNLPVADQASWYENAMESTVYDCNRLKDFTFETNGDGTPKTAKWCGQSIGLWLHLGYTTNRDYILNYNSGITADKEVVDDATYQALKNDPDWFTCNKDYSRYNHDSAVNTINSLPDTSGFVAENGSSNAVVFEGAAGSLTDGGAINTLTEEEIAVAAAKGWTVMFM